MTSDRPGTRLDTVQPSRFHFAPRQVPHSGLRLPALLAALLMTAVPQARSQPLSPSPADSAILSADTSLAAAAPVEAVNLSVEGRFTTPAPAVGDSLDYVLKVEWADAGVPVVVLAPDSLDFQGFDILGQATFHKKLADTRGVQNRTEFVYRLRAKTQGSARAASLKLRYLSGISRSEESVFVPSTLVDIAPAPTRLLESLWFRLLAALLLLALAGLGGHAAYRAARRRSEASARKPDGTDLRPEVLALKSRLKGGDSRDILLEMESVCARHLKARLAPLGKASVKAAIGDAAPPVAASAPPAGANAPRFDALLDRYLASDGAEGQPEDWKSLRDLFQHARFAGGHKEPHELQDAYRTLKRCLRITDEPGEE